MIRRVLRLLVEVAALMQSEELVREVALTNST